MLRIGNIAELEDVKDVIILGAGKDGKAVAKDLLHRDIRVHAFVDDNRYGRRYFGIDVVSPKEICINNVPCILCIGALAYLSNEQILEHRFIKALGIDGDNLIVLDRFLFIRDRFVFLCKKNNIDLTSDVINFDKFSIPNYLNMNESIQRTFILECCDLILPSIFSDFLCVDEGPYDHENVSVCQYRGGTRVPVNGKIVIDCGASLGLFSVYAAHAGVKRVYSFEPIKQSRDLLQLACSNYNNINIVPKALADRVGNVFMSNSDNLGQNKIIDNKSGVAIDCTTLDQFVMENELASIDFIKADIEGAERYMLEGARWVLRNFSPDLSICTYHLDDDPVVLEGIIRSANPEYVVKHAYKKLYAYVPK